MEKILQVPFVELSSSIEHLIRGSVYRGTWRGIAVAVKVCLGQDEDYEGVQRLANYHARHVRIARLLAFAYSSSSDRILASKPDRSGRTLLLVYGLVAGGSLADWLKGKHGEAPMASLRLGSDFEALSAEVRLDIAMGVCDATRTLHDDSIYPLLRPPLSSANIGLVPVPNLSCRGDSGGLLFYPKLLNCGVAELLERNTSCALGGKGSGDNAEEITDRRGKTNTDNRPSTDLSSFKDKAVASQKACSIYADIFSLGVILLELFTGCLESSGDVQEVANDYNPIYRNADFFPAEEVEFAIVGSLMARADRSARWRRGNSNRRKKRDEEKRGDGEQREKEGYDDDDDSASKVMAELILDCLNPSVIKRPSSARDVLGRLQQVRRLLDAENGSDETNSIATPPIVSCAQCNEELSSAAGVWCHCPSHARRSSSLPPSPWFSSPSSRQTAHFLCHGCLQVAVVALKDAEGGDGVLPCPASGCDAVPWRVRDDLLRHLDAATLVHYYSVASERLLSSQTKTVMATEEDAPNHIVAADLAFEHKEKLRSRVLELIAALQAMGVEVLTRTNHSSDVSGGSRRQGGAVFTEELLEAIVRKYPLRIQGPATSDNETSLRPIGENTPPLDELIMLLLEEDFDEKTWLPDAQAQDVQSSDDRHLLTISADDESRLTFSAGVEEWKEGCCANHEQDGNGTLRRHDDDEVSPNRKLLQNSVAANEYEEEEGEGEHNESSLPPSFSATSMLSSEADASMDPATAALVTKLLQEDANSSSAPCYSADDVIVPAPGYLPTLTTTSSEGKSAVHFVEELPMITSTTGRALRYTGPLNTDRRPHGQGGIVIFPDNCSESYRGDYRNGIRHGHGISIFSNGESYEGAYHNGKMREYLRKHFYLSSFLLSSRYSDFVFLRWARMLSIR